MGYFRCYGEYSGDEREATMSANLNAYLDSGKARAKSELGGVFCRLFWSMNGSVVVFAETVRNLHFATFHRAGIQIVLAGNRLRSAKSIGVYENSTLGFRCNPLLFWASLVSELAPRPKG